MSDEWIGLLRFSRPAASHLQKHSLTPADVDEAISRGAEHSQAWHTDTKHGRRLVVTGTTYSGRLIMAFLRPINRHDGTWRCISARSV